MTEEAFQGRADRLERRCVIFAPPVVPEASALKGTPDSTTRSAQVPVNPWFLLWKQRVVHALSAL